MIIAHFTILFFILKNQTKHKYLVNYSKIRKFLKKFCNNFVARTLCKNWTNLHPKGGLNVEADDTHTHQESMKRFITYSMGEPGTSRAVTNRPEKAGGSQESGLG